MAREPLSKEDQADIERAVKEAEAKTSAEIVVAVAPRSGRYHRAADMFGVLCGLVAVALAWILWQDLAPASGDWQTGQAPTLGLWWVLLLFAAWFVIGAAAATHWPVLLRPFATNTERLDSVKRRGTEAYHRLHVARTKAATGLLIYVSLFERTVWVCPDDGIGSKLNDGAWTPLSDLIAAGFRSGKPGPALASAVRKAGQILAEKFPAADGDVNEIPDTVRVLKDRAGQE